MHGTRKFEVGDLFCVHLRKERFPGQGKHTFMPRTEGTFEVLERINHNAYTIDLGDKHDVSTTFNIGELAPYMEDEELRRTPFEEEEDDVKSVPQHFEHIILAKSFEDSSFDSYGLHGPFIMNLALTYISRSW